MEWEDRGGAVVKDLMRDLSLTAYQAAGIVGNIGYESAGFTKLHEIGQPEGKGGYGWAQWTGPRRVSFFAWCDDKGLDWRSDEANYGYLLQELRTTQKKSLVQLKKTTSLEAAVFTFGYHFEKPGGTTKDFLPGYDDRLEYAQRALRTPVVSHLDEAIAVFKAASALMQNMLKEEGFETLSAYLEAKK